MVEYSIDGRGSHITLLLRGEVWIRDPTLVNTPKAATEWFTGRLDINANSLIADGWRNIPISLTDR